MAKRSSAEGSTSGKESTPKKSSAVEDFSKLPDKIELDGDKLGPYLALREGRVYTLYRVATPNGELSDEARLGTMNWSLEHETFLMRTPVHGHDPKLWHKLCVEIERKMRAHLGIGETS